MIRFGFISLLLIVSFSCSKKNQPQQEAYNSWAIVMDKSGCYGSCPIYTLRIESNGKVELNAKRFLPIEGIFSGSLSGDDLNVLIEQTDNMQWSDYEQEYMTGYSDLPSTSFMYLNGVGDTFYLCYEKGMPPIEISQLGKNLEIVQDTTFWIPMKSH